MAWLRNGQSITFAIMRLLPVYCLITACLLACRPEVEQEVTPPAGILSHDRMIEVLTDSYLAESATGLNVLAVRGDKFDSAYVFNAFKDNGITKPQFDSSLAFYSRHPKTLKSIYEKVLEKLSKIQAAGKVK